MTSSALICDSAGTDYSIAWLNEEDKLSTWDQAGKFTKYNQNDLFILVMFFKSNLKMLHAQMTARMHVCICVQLSKNA